MRSTTLASVNSRILEQRKGSTRRIVGLSTTNCYDKTLVDAFGPYKFLLVSVWTLGKSITLWLEGSHHSTCIFGKLAVQRNRLRNLAPKIAAVIFIQILIK